MEAQFNILTSQIANEVVESHFALGLDVGGVHVSVEENHGEGQDENGVWVVKLLHHVWITHTVSLAVEGVGGGGVHWIIITDASKKNKCCGSNSSEAARRTTGEKTKRSLVRRNSKMKNK